ncbi:MAG: glycoside hydrolase family 38 C-terminal domain-containing protein, partial [Lentisphaeria bacterium]
EMLPPTDLPERLAAWTRQAPELRFQFGTQRRLAGIFAAAEAQVDAPPPALVAGRVENNPTQTGCYVSRLRIKQEARRCEAAFYGWETALAVTLAGGLRDAAAWEQQFLELPLFFFHDAVTGTHQDEAYRELKARMAAMRHTTARLAHSELRTAGRPGVRAPTPAAGRRLAVFDPGAAPGPRRIPLPPAFATSETGWVAEDAAGRAWPVVPSWRADSPPAPLPENRLLAAVGPAAATRPAATGLFVETDALAPLAWTTFTLRPAPPPVPLAEPVLRNPHLEVRLGDPGIAGVTDLATGAVLDAPAGGAIGELLLQEDEGDPWGVRKIPGWRRGLAEFTRFLGAKQFAGYQEAWFAGAYAPCLRFGREADPRIFALEWYVTVRLAAHARQVDISHEIYWKSADRRLRIRFPAGAPADTAWYGIPGGWLARPRYEQTATHLFSPDGDWPATTFVAAAPGPAGTGWAVVNYGTPAGRVADGAIEVSVLRSPAFGHCLERYAQNYPMPVSGIRDGGWRHVTLSLLPHRGADDLPRLAVTAAGLNLAPPAVAVGKRGTAGPLPAWPLRITGAPVELAAVKFPFDGAPGGRIVRLVNPAPHAAAVTLRLPPECAGAFHSCDLLEQPAAPLAPAAPGRWPLTLRPFQILTLRWQPAGQPDTV